MYQYRIRVLAPLSHLDLCGLSFVEYKQTDVGRCETCGFFSKHGRDISAPPPRFYEVEIPDRTNFNEIFTYYGSNRQHVGCETVCFRRKVNFMREIRKLQGTQEQGNRLVEMVRENRKCGAWWPYMPGFSPMEHYTEFHMMELEQRRKDYESGLENDRRRYEKDMADRAEENRRAFETAQRSRDRLLIGAGLVFTVIQIVLAIFTLRHESFTDQILRHIFER